MRKPQVSILAIAALVLPCASPFPVGVSASIANVINPRKPADIPSSTSLVANHPSEKRSPPHANQYRQLARQMASVDAVVADTGKKRLSLARVVRFIKGKDGPREDNWKGGEEAASLPSRLLFRYATPLLDLASKRRLAEDDAFYVSEQNNMNTTVASLTTIYDGMREKSRRKIEVQRQAGADKVKASQTLLLTKALLKHKQTMLIWTGFLRLVNTLVQAFPSILLARLLRLVEAGDTLPAHKAFSAAVSLVAVLLVKMLTENQYFHYVVKAATETRGALSGLIFDKSLRLPGGGSGVTHKTDQPKGQRTALGTGGVLNLMQSDASIIEFAAMQVHTIWDGALQISMYTALLYKCLGPSVWFGIAVLLLTIPLNSYTLRVLNRLAIKENEAKDARTKRTSESIANMKLLKLQGWEQQFADDIRTHRADELKRHATKGAVRALNQAISNSVPALVLAVTLTAYVKTGRPILASTIFTAISLFNQLRFPLFFYPMLINSLADGKNAMQRISSYMSSEDLTPYVETLPPTSNGGGSIKIENGNFLWSTSKPPKDGEVAAPTVPALYDANLEVKPGEVVAVVGPVGSGKSALVKALLGELAPVPKTVVQQSIVSSMEGTEDDFRKLNSAEISSSIMNKPAVTTQSNIAYCSQEAWLSKGTIREAVVFGREYNEDRYMAAIRDAGLDDDIVDGLNGANSKAAASSGVLSHDTDVGEGGSSLSGGQRARVALARALYAGEDTKVFLLDDCLAALDASVGSMVFERLTKRLKDAGAATVLVTNDPNLPRRCDRVVLMQKVPSSPSCSTIADVGKYDELIGRGHRLISLSTDDIEEEEDQDSPRVSDNTAQDGKPQDEQIEFIKNQDEKSITVLGGYEKTGNDTTHCSHADPECHAALELCPDFIVHNADKMNEDKIREEDESVQIETQHDMSCAPPDDEKRQAKNGKEVQTSPTVKKLASTDDTMATGAVPRSAYITYMKSVRKPLLIAAMLSAFLLSNSAQFFQQYVVAKWTELGRGDAIAVALGEKYLRQLVNAAGVVSVSLWLRSFFTMRVGVRASEFLHSRMLDSVFSAPMSFFDATPSGQILSRFGKEMQTVDRSVPDSIGTVLFCFLQIFMSAAALAGVVTPAMVVPIAAVGSMYVRTMKRFRPGARDLKRIETKTRSPIYTHFGEALRGTEIIRSISGSRLFWSGSHRNMMDTNLRSFYSVKALDRWLSCRLETLGNVVVFTAAVASVWLTRVGQLKAGSAGWGLTQSLAITGLMTWAVRCLTDLETNMMSLVRVKELTDLDSDEVKLKDENSEEKPARMPKEKARQGEALEPLFGDSSLSSSVALAPTNDEALAGWPWYGGIQLENVSMRYNEASKLILRGVDLEIPPGTTLGLVGRTGSGKSSLLLTLFRLVEIEAGGRIEIDGVDLRSVSLQKLRESLAIIPQDPVLFAGTVAYNLDATGRKSPESMWEALEAASPSMAEQFRQSGGLETPVVEGGKNLSVGQRQLLCLARALLRKSKILVLDEATASVDPATDQEVQRTIRREFVDKGVTVVTVAHRLETVLGYDKIAVLGDGKVLEYGIPKELVKIRNGELRRLVEADRQSKKKGAKIEVAV